MLRLTLGMLMRLESLQSRSFFSIPGKEYLDFWESRLVTRDVKTVYFSEPVTGLPKPVFYRLPVTERPIVNGIIVTGRSALAISRSLVASRRPWPAYQTHWRRRSETKDSGICKWQGAAGADVSAAGRWYPTYATASARQCKCGRFSLPL